MPKPIPARRPVAALAAVPRLILALVLGLTIWSGLAALHPALPQPSATAMAQTAPEPPDYAAWDKQATQADTLINDKADSETLDQVRADLVTWRSRFQDAQGINGPQIATLREQIQSLGPKPAEGESEAAEIAERRGELNKQLADAQAPSLTAVEAYSRADALIGRIDRLERERQASALMFRNPSPLLPSSWAEALTATVEGAGALTNEVRARLADGRTMRALQENALTIGAEVALALLLLLRGRAFVEGLSNRLVNGSSARFRRVSAFLVSLGQIVAPMVGLYLMSLAVTQAGVVGTRGELLAVMIPVGGACLFIAHWLGRRLFPRRREMDSVLPVQDDRRTEARLHLALMGLTVGLALVLENGLLPTMGLPTASPPTPAGAATVAVTYLPLILLAAFSLYRFSQLVRRGAKADAEADGSLSARDRFVGLAAILAVLAALAAPVLAVLGYTSMANALIWPAILSMGLICLLVLLQDFFADVYAMVLRDSEGARDALIPVLIGFALVLASLPLFGLIWGMRTAELAELWTRFRSGVSLGGVKISPTAILTFAIVFAAGYMVTRLLQGTMRVSVLPKTRIDKGGQNAIVSGLGYVGIFLAALAAITSAGIDLSSLAIVAGALSVGIGFGLQNIVSNFVSGIILLIERPITEGDWIEVGGQQGYVRAISVRSTRIETFDRTDVIVPNADFVSGQVINYTRGNLNGRLILPIGVAYGTDTRKVEKILREIAENHPIVMLSPPPAVVFVSFGDSALNFEIRAILSDVNQIMSTRSEMNHQIAARFAEEGIEIPFPQQDLWLRNPETLRPPPAPLKLTPRANQAEATREGPEQPADFPQVSHDDLHRHGDRGHAEPMATGRRPLRLDEQRRDDDEDDGDGDGDGDGGGNGGAPTATS
ncbi:DUF3772 domain-containing protein [Paracoccus sp. p4-l81]|uniref:DUF3772 domain-containing protein n=1 Tax=Paracoccus sp. p4-l81 TaxID=3342806 RepID=UPI0035B9FF30